MNYTKNIYNYININDISLDLSSEEETSFTDDIYQTLRAKNEFNQFNDPYFYYRYHYAHASAENIRLLDLLNDNVSINENQRLIINNGMNLNLISDRNDLLSLNNNNTDLSSRINQISRNNNFNLNSYNNNFNLNNPNVNLSSNSSHITSLLKMPKMKKK